MPSGDAEESVPVVEALSRRPEAWIDFMMRFVLGLEQPDPKRALRSALTIAGAYTAESDSACSLLYFPTGRHCALCFNGRDAGRIAAFCLYQRTVHWRTPVA